MSKAPPKTLKPLGKEMREWLALPDRLDPAPRKNPSPVDVQKVLQEYQQKLSSKS